MEMWPGWLPILQRMLDIIFKAHNVLLVVVIFLFFWNCWICWIFLHWKEKEQQIFLEKSVTAHLWLKRSTSDEFHRKRHGRKQKKSYISQSARTAVLPIITNIKKLITIYTRHKCLFPKINRYMINLSWALVRRSELYGACPTLVQNKRRVKGILFTWHSSF